MKYQRLNSSHELQRMCVMVFGRFHRIHRIKDLDDGVELRGGVASSVQDHLFQIKISRGVPQRFHLEVN